MDTGESMKERREAGLASGDSRGSGKAEEIMTENTFFLFPVQPWGRSQAPAGHRCAEPSSRGLHTPSHTFSSIPFPFCWFYVLHSLTAQQHRLQHPSPSRLRARERDGEKRVPRLMQDWDTTKLLLFPASPGKSPRA